MPIASINPATGECLKEFTPDTEQIVSAKIDRAHAAWRQFRETPFSERSKWMLRAAELLESQKEDLARTMTLEMGKLVKASREEVAKCSWVCRYYAEHAAHFLADEPAESTATRSFIRYQPLGIVLAIMPWNFPFWQVFRFAAPALMAGNAGLLKHASNVPQCALAIERIFREAGVPDGLFQTLLVESGGVELVIRDERIRAVTLTGSEPAGTSVAALAGSLVKKSVLELGGSDPFIVMPSANLAEAAATAVRARVINNGQSCIAAKRFIVHRDIAEEFTRLLVHGMESLRVGDPMLEETELGPLVSEQLLLQLDTQVRISISMGATLLTGGQRLERPGSYYAPTILTKIPHASPAWSEELFGPVAMVFEARDLDDAIRIANDTPFGLGSAAWTTVPAEQEQFINRLESGLVFINGMVASDPRLPFGGVKHSGYGRELGVHGIREFVNIKTVWIR